jgi:alkylated DNA nucleotide flippase Atl1
VATTASSRGELLTEHILRAVEQIPRGRVATYGDIARVVGCGPRQVGLVMSRAGGSVCWWRVVSASGDLSVADKALAHWAEEGIEAKPSGRGCRVAEHRADLGVLAADYAMAVTDLPCLAIGRSTGATERGRPR